MYWTPSIQSYSVAALVNAGLSLFGAAGLVSRWMNVEAAQGPTSVNPSSGAFGIAQWLGSRLPPIQGNTSLDDQIAYVIEELNGSESRAGDVLRNATNADEGAVGASMYERAEGYNASTGRDNFTGRTASGIPEVIASIGDSGDGIHGTSYSSFLELPPLDSGSSSALAGIALFVIGALIFRRMF